MKKITYLIALLMLSTILSAQKTNLSGNWSLNREKSQLGEQFSMAPSKIEISQEKNMLTEVRHSEFQGEELTLTNKFTLDGKDCENPGWMDSVIKSTANWSDDKSTLKIAAKFTMQNGEEMTINSAYSLKEGRLVIVTKGNSSYGEFGETQVYDKIK